MKRIAFFATVLMILAALLFSSCGADPLKGHWMRDGDRSIEIYDFQNGKFTYTTLFLVFDISFRGTYEISNGQIVFKFTEFLNVGEGKWQPLSEEELVDLKDSLRETVSYSIEEDVLVMDGNPYTRLSDDEYIECFGEDVIKFFPN